jgi:hypothetical protein
LTAVEINTAFSRPLSPHETLHASDGSRSGSEPEMNIVMPVPSDAPKPRFWHPKYGQPSSTWSYVDANGALIGYVCRFDPPFGPAVVGDDTDRKQYAPYTLWRGPTGVRWKWKHWPAPRPLYGLKELADNPTSPAVIVEGEKCADAARRVFPRSVIVASPGGSNAARKADWSPLTGRQVLIWPDADEPGLGYACEVTGIAAGLGSPDIRAVDAMALVRRGPDGNARDHIEGWDVVDALEEGWEPEALREAAVAVSSKPEPKADAGLDTNPDHGTWEHPDLSLLGNGCRAAPVFPLSLLGSYWADWVERKARGASGPVDYVATALLASTGAMLANVRWATAGASWSEPPVIWAGLVGGPSSSKSPSIDAAFGLVRHVEDLMGRDFELQRRTYETARESAEATKEAWKERVKVAVKKGEEAPLKPASAEVPEAPMRPRVRVADATIEKLGVLAAALPRGLLLVRDELAGWLGAFDRYGGGGSDRAFAIEMYGGRSYVVDRMRSSEPLHIRHLSVGVLGGVQPDKLPAIISGPDDGLAARFLWAWPDVSSGFSLLREDSNDALAQDAFAKLADLSMGSDEFGLPEPKRLRLAPDAEDAIEEFGREMAKRADEATGVFSGALGKARGHVMRLSNVIEHLWWCGELKGAEPAVISRHAVVAAAGLLDGYFIPMAGRVFGDASIPTAERNAMALARYLRAHRMKEFNAKKMRREIGGNLREAAPMEAACNALVDAGLIRARFERAGSTPGRPAKNFEVNPVVWERQP